LDISVVVPTLEPSEDLPVEPSLERCAFEDYELLVQDEEPVTRARNAGIDRASSDKIVFLDDDSVVRDGYLTRASEVLTREMAYAGRVVHPHDDIFNRDFTGHYSFGEEPRYVDRFWGCNMGIRKEVFEEVGGWDEGMGWGHEEKELAVRVSDAFDIYYDPELLVYHPYAESLPDFWKKNYKLGRQMPRYWDRRGYSTAQKLHRISSTLVDPFNYVGRTPRVAVARAGRTLAKSAGRLAGMLRYRT
jgi:GT2 family glycosyltransferase